MFKPLIYLNFLFFTLIQSATIEIQFPTFPSVTDIGSCTCDLTVSQCDASCCCDPDCSSTGDQNAFACSSRDNIYTNSTPALSSVQPTCFKNISIFHSNSPYIIQKMGELVCVDYERYTGSQYYQQPKNQNIDTNTFRQKINSQYSVLPAYSVPSDLTNYQVGTPILTNSTDAQIFSFPSSLFGNDQCSGLRSITYMNNFTSTCTQLVVEATCTGALNSTTYLNSLCLKQSPGSSIAVCANTSTLTASIWSSPDCSNVLTSLTIQIYYSNPSGIINVTALPTHDTATGRVQQTFTVEFIKSETVEAVGSPGYRKGTVINVGTKINSTITLSDSSPFFAYEPSASGGCNAASPVGFGENIQSTCKSNATCADLLNELSPSNITDPYVAAYANSSISNSTTDWLPIKIYKSLIGSSDQEQSVSSFSELSSSGDCYIRLHIQIAYTNIGSIKNPQSILSAVIFHYQYNSTSMSSTLLTKSITFQEIKNTPIVEQGRIPTPNTRLPADFFYPFSSNSATKSMTFSFEFLSFLFLSFVLLLV